MVEQAQPGHRDDSPHPCGIYGAARPGSMPVSTALPSISDKDEVTWPVCDRPCRARPIRPPSHTTEPPASEPLTPCMPCHPHQFMELSAATPGTASAVLRKRVRQGAVMPRVGSLVTSIRSHGAHGSSRG